MKTPGKGMPKGNGKKLTGGFRVAALTEKHWPAMVELLDVGGPCSRCWCMYWRIGGEYRRRSAAENRDDFERVVREGPPPGLLAFDGKVVVGWCQVTKRVALPQLEKTLRLPAEEDDSVWAISCFYVRKGYRGMGVTRALVEGAMQRARKAGAIELEAYPLDRDRTPSSSSTGFRTSFEKAGFRVVRGDGESRVVARKRL